MPLNGGMYSNPCKTGSLKLCVLKITAKACILMCPFGGHEKLDLQQHLVLSEHDENKASKLNDRVQH